MSRVRMAVLRIGLLVPGLIGSAPGLGAQSAAPHHVVFAPTLWLCNVDGRNRVSGLDVAVEDTVLDVGAEMRVEVGGDRVRGMASLSRAAVSSRGAVTVDSTLPAVQGAFDFTIWQAELFGAVRVGPRRWPDALELYTGVRYVRQYEEVGTPRGPGLVSTRESWLDPVIGARFSRSFRDGLWATVLADMAGFGLGSAFTWRLETEVGVHVHPSVALTLRYRYQEMHYTNGPSDYRWEGSAQGWFLGLAYAPQ